LRRPARPRAVRPGGRLGTVVAAGLATAALAATALPLPTAAAQEIAAGELFFSEYVEGGGNNKAVEIYNPSDSSVELDGYAVEVYFNGGTSASTRVPLTGSVAPGGVHVLGDDDADGGLLRLLDQTTGSSLWNGDDAVALVHDGATLDVIGRIGTDPGSAYGSGEVTTQDHTLRRSATVSGGDTDGTDPFDPAEEWEAFPKDTFDGLGSHRAGPAPDVAPEVSEVSPADGSAGLLDDTSVTVTFSEPVDVQEGALSLVCDGGAVAGSTKSGDDGLTVTFDPTGPLPADSTCTVTVHAANVTDRDGEPDPMAADFTSGFGVGEAGSPCTHQRLTPAYEIQGSGAEAAVTGPVTTRGVVVGDYETGGLDGFYLQDARGDGDPSTSDGIFVYDPGRDLVHVGDVVTVRGEAQDHFQQTEISADRIDVCASGASVRPTNVHLPFRGEADRERVEGMLVRLPQRLAVTETYQLGRFGQVLLSAHGRLPQPTNVFPPGERAERLAARNARNQILIDDASQRQNPDPIPFARDGQPLSAENTLRGGDTAHGIVGVMTYTWGGNAASPNAFRVRPENALGGQARFRATNSRPRTPERVGGDLRVASFNVLNYFNTFHGCTGGVGEQAQGMDCRGADSPAELERQADKIVAALVGLDADVVGLIEIENDGYGADSALQDLVDRLNERVGADTYAFVDVDEQTGEVDALGHDAIKVGMLYKPEVVTPAGTAALNTDSFVNGDSGEPRNRPALAQSFRDHDGEVATVVVNHLKSKGSDCEADGDPDTGDGQGNCVQTRTDAARELAAWLAQDPTGADDPDVLVMGDLNSYAMEDPIRALEGAGLVNLVRRFEGRSAYSYVFDGRWGYLDHALSSASLARQVRGVTTWHINADEPPVLDYNTEFKSADQVADLYAPTPFRSSDHDPVLVGLDLRSPPGHGHGHGRPGRH
jgi:predicted extracellular nuclease